MDSNYFRPSRRQTHDGIDVTLGAVSSVVVALNLATILRVPTPFADLQLYASIARARQIYGIGVPTVIWNSPTAVDHVPFYGPVFFDLAALALRYLGVTLLSFRLVSLLGAVLVGGGAALLARQLGASRDQWRWSVLLLVLAPEIGGGMATGAMHILAIGFELVGLAVFVRGFNAPARLQLPHGIAAGALLGLAALTTPRSYLFIAAFAIAGALLFGRATPVSRDARRQFAAAMITWLAIMTVWTTVSHHNPLRWARYMTYIFLHEDTDVAILPTAVRDWSFSWMPIVTPIAAVLGGCLAVSGLLRARHEPRRPETIAQAFALSTTALTLVLTVVILNYTFSNGDYFALPLLACVLAMPPARLGVRPRVLAACVATLIACDLGLLGVRLARTAATWAARDPAPLNAFVRDHVPPGSAVMGPRSPYFFPVERNGSHYFAIAPNSWADWARWVPAIEPDAVAHPRGMAVSPDSRFLIWPADTDVPLEYECAKSRIAGVFRPAPHHLERLGRLGHPLDVGYVETILFAVPAGCPTGYDPSSAPQTRQ